MLVTLLSARTMPSVSLREMALPGARVQKYVLHHSILFAVLIQGHSGMSAFLGERLVLCD